MGWARGQESALSHFCGFRSSLGCEFELLQEFGLFQEFHKIRDFPQSLLGNWLQIGHRVVRKIVLYVVCFAYSLL